MHYAQKLKQENLELRGKLRDAQDTLIQFQSFLNSEKFRNGDSGDRKDWIATADVINWIREFRPTLES